MPTPNYHSYTQNEKIEEMMRLIDETPPHLSVEILELKDLVNAYRRSPEYTHGAL